MNLNMKVNQKNLLTIVLLKQLSNKIRI